MILLHECPTCRGLTVAEPVEVLDVRGDAADAVLVECDCGFSGIDPGAPWLATPVLVRPR